MSPSLRALLLVAVALLQGGTSELPIQDFQGESGIAASVDGQARKLFLSTQFPDSYLTGGDGEVHAVTVGDRPFAKVPLNEAKDVDLCGAEGALGMDALRQVCLAIDPLNEKLEVLPGTKIGMEGAQAYFAKLPHWTDSAHVVKIPLGRAEDGTPTFEATAGGEKTRFVLSLSTYTTYLDPTVKRPKETNGTDKWSYAPAVALAGLSPHWLEYTPDADWNAEEEGGHGEVALDAFLSRRVIVDLADDAAYVEDLPEDERLTVQLVYLTRFPLAVSGEGLLVRKTPGLLNYDIPEVYYGAKIVRLAGFTASEWLGDLKGDTGEAAERLTKKIEAFEEGCEATAVFADGQERTFNIPKSATTSPQALGGSLRAGGRARVASRSR